MLIKNGKPCKDRWQYECDGCGEHSEYSPDPNFIVFMYGSFICAGSYFASGDGKTLQFLCPVCIQMRQANVSKEAALQAILGVNQATPAAVETPLAGGTPAVQPAIELPRQFEEASAAGPAATQNEDPQRPPNTIMIRGRSRNEPIDNSCPECGKPE